MPLTRSQHGSESGQETPKVMTPVEIEILTKRIVEKEERLREQTEALQRQQEEMEKSRRDMEQAQGTADCHVRGMRNEIRFEN